MELTLLGRPQLSVHPIAMVGGEEAPGGAGADLGAPAAPTEVAEVLTQNKTPPKRWFLPQNPILWHQKVRVENVWCFPSIHLRLRISHWDTECQKRQNRFVEWD